MARNYGVKQKIIIWDVFDGIDGDGGGGGAVLPLELNSSNLGFDPRRRAMLITIGGAAVADANMSATVFKLQMKGYATDGTTAEWINVGWKREALTSRDITSSQTYVIDTLDDIMRVRARDYRIGVTSGQTDGDPGTVTVTVTAKRVPSNMRDE
jgi:hypothetical protein